MTTLPERPRRLRRTESLRKLVQETELSPNDLVMPLFVVPGTGVSKPIPSMPGNNHLSVDQLLPVCEELSRTGISGVLLFGIPEGKDEQGSSAWDENGPVPEAIRRIRKALPELVIITDVCLCAYTTHGHCGVIVEESINNDATLPLLSRMALCHAQAGADIVAPSDMMDGRVGTMRQALDADGFTDTAILSYAAKYASSYYGPFRDAACSAPGFGDRKTHQMNPANIREALREVALDIREGADMVMVKPALAYLDVVNAIRQAVSIPVVAYNVSGEFSMVKAASEKGWIDEKMVVLETLTSMKRAGADIIISYHALDAARWMLPGAGQ